MVHQCLGCLNDLLGQFSKQLNLKESSHFSNTPKIGRMLADLTEEADSMFGGMIVIDTFINLLNGIISIFCGVGIAGIYGDEVNSASVAFSFSFLILAIFSLYRIYYTQRFGQNLANSFSDVR